MLKKKINRKLKSEKGTSIFFGLLLFMVASMVSVMILNGAVTAVKRVESDRKAEQNYLVCSSAARMLRDVIENSVIKWQKKEILNDKGNAIDAPVITWSGSSVNGTATEDEFVTFFKDFIKDYSEQSDILNNSYTKTFTISVPSNLSDKKDDIGEITAIMTIRKSTNIIEGENSGFDISVLLTTGTGSDTCQMILSLSGKVTFEKTETENKIDNTTESVTDNTIDDTEKTITIITSLTYNWEAVDIFYGDKERSVTE